MSMFVPAYLGALALLLGMVVAMASGTERLNRISGWIFAPAGLIGLGLYVAAFSRGQSSLAGVVGSILRGLFATCKMFLGVHEFSSVEGLFSPSSVPGGVLVLFWAAHLGALFVTASAVLSTLGKKLLQAMRSQLLLVVRPRMLFLIFGLNAQSVTLGPELVARRGALVVYIDAKPPKALADQAMGLGAIVRTGACLTEAKANARLLRSVGLGKRLRGRKTHIMLMDEDERTNIDVAQALTRRLAQNGADPRRVCIDLRCGRELSYGQLERFEPAQGNRYNISAFSDAELSARLLIHQAAPYKAMRFDASGRATNDFHALIIGFGQVGQSILRQVAMNGQFCGSAFAADVVDVKADSVAGQFKRRYPGLGDAFGVRFHQMDVRSDAFYEKLDAWAPTLCYIVICVQSDALSGDIAADLERYFDRHGGTRPIILVSVCNQRYVACTQENIRFFDWRQQVYGGDVFLREMSDHMAKAVNLNYHEQASGETSAERAWSKADYFSRESARASADFIPAMLAAAGISREEAADRERFAQAVPAGSEMLESLAITEHMRWNAFHLAMGYTSMPPEEVRERAQRGITPVHKDLRSLRHACIAPWEALDALSAQVGGLTGNAALDYKEMDRKNIYEIPRTLTLKVEIDDGRAGRDA